MTGAPAAAPSGAPFSKRAAVPEGSLKELLAATKKEPIDREVAMKKDEEALLRRLAESAKAQRERQRERARALAYKHRIAAERGEILAGGIRETPKKENKTTTDDSLSRDDAARLVQTSWRGFKHRRFARRNNRAAIAMQKMARGLLGRRALRILEARRRRLEFEAKARSKRRKRVSELLKQYDVLKHASPELVERKRQQLEAKRRAARIRRWREEEAEALKKSGRDDRAVADIMERDYDVEQDMAKERLREEVKGGEEKKESEDIPFIPPSPRDRGGLNLFPKEPCDEYFDKTKCSPFERCEMRCIDAYEEAMKNGGISKVIDKAKNFRSEMQKEMQMKNLEEGQMPFDIDRVKAVAHLSNDEDKIDKLVELYKQWAATSMKDATTRAWDNQEAEAGRVELLQHLEIENARLFKEFTEVHIPAMEKSRKRRSQMMEHLNWMKMRFEQGDCGKITSLEDAKQKLENDPFYKLPPRPSDQKRAFEYSERVLKEQRQQEIWRKKKEASDLKKQQEDAEEAQRAAECAMKGEKYKKKRPPLLATDEDWELEKLHHEVTNWHQISVDELGPPVDLRTINPTQPGLLRDKGYVKRDPNDPIVDEDEASLYWFEYARKDVEATRALRMDAELDFAIAEASIFAAKKKLSKDAIDAALVAARAAVENKFRNEDDDLLKVRAQLLEVAMNPGKREEDARKWLKEKRDSKRQWAADMICMAVKERLFKEGIPQKLKEEAMQNEKQAQDKIAKIIQAQWRGYYVRHVLDRESRKKRVAHAIECLVDEFGGNSNKKKDDAATRKRRVAEAAEQLSSAFDDKKKHNNSAKNNKTSFTANNKIDEDDVVTFPEKYKPGSLKTETIQDVFSQEDYDKVAAQYPENKLPDVPPRKLGKYEVRILKWDYAKHLKDKDYNFFPEDEDRSKFSYTPQLFQMAPMPALDSEDIKIPTREEILSKIKKSPVFDNKKDDPVEIYTPEELLEIHSGKDKKEVMKDAITTPLEDFDYGDDDLKGAVDDLMASLNKIKVPSSDADKENTKGFYNKETAAPFLSCKYTPPTTPPPFSMADFSGPPVSMADISGLSAATTTADTAAQKEEETKQQKEEYFTKKKDDVLDAPAKEEEVKKDTKIPEGLPPRLFPEKSPIPPAEKKERRKPPAIKLDLSQVVKPEFNLPSDDDHDAQKAAFYGEALAPFPRATPPRDRTASSLSKK